MFFFYRFTVTFSSDMQTLSFFFPSWLSKSRRRNSAAMLLVCAVGAVGRPKGAFTLRVGQQISERTANIASSPPPLMCAGVLFGERMPRTEKMRITGLKHGAHGVATVLSVSSNTARLPEGKGRCIKVTKHAVYYLDQFTQEFSWKTRAGDTVLMR